MKHYSLISGVIVLAGALGTWQIQAQGTAETQKVTLASPAQIPGGELAAGAYTFSLEDNMTDRAIIRIQGNGQEDHHLILGVPNPALRSSGRGGVVWFRAAADGSRALRGWKCARCAATLEFVYPKLDAVKITDGTAEPVMAVDPAYDKLPQNLSQDDMKVVTLWLLSPKRITADNRGEGVSAKKYSDSQHEALRAEAPKKAEGRELPATASHTTEIGMIGLAGLAFGVMLSVLKRRVAA